MSFTMTLARFFRQSPTASYQPNWKGYKMSGNPKQWHWPGASWLQKAALQEGTQGLADTKLTMSRCCSLTGMKAIHTFSCIRERASSREVLPPLFLKGACETSRGGLCPVWGSAVQERLTAKASEIVKGLDYMTLRSCWEHWDFSDWKKEY